MRKIILLGAAALALAACANPYVSEAQQQCIVLAGLEAVGNSVDAAELRQKLIAAGIGCMVTPAGDVHAFAAPLPRP